MSGWYGTGTTHHTASVTSSERSRQPPPSTPHPQPITRILHSSNPAPAVTLPAHLTAWSRVQPTARPKTDAQPAQCNPCSCHRLRADVRTEESAAGGPGSLSTSTSNSSSSDSSGRRCGRAGRLALLHRCTSTRLSHSCPPASTLHNCDYGERASGTERRGGGGGGRIGGMSGCSHHHCCYWHWSSGQWRNKEARKQEQQQQHSSQR